jgi:hypothetical protein
LKNNFLITLVITIVLVASSATTVMAQTVKKSLGEKRFYVFFSQGSSKVDSSQNEILSEIKDYLWENPKLSVFFNAHRSQMGWKDESGGKSSSRDGGASFEMTEAVAKAIGLKNFKVEGTTTQGSPGWYHSFGQKNDTPFLMVTVKEDPNDRQDREICQLQDGQKKLEKDLEEQGELLHKNTEDIATLSAQENETQQTADGAYSLAKSAKDLAGDNASDIDSLRQKIDDLKNKTQKTPKFRLLRAGVGAMSIMYDDIEPMTVPVARLEVNLSDRIGLQIEGGIVPGYDFENETTWDGIFNAAIFCRPLSFMKILAGYNKASNFYESDFAFAKSEDDGPMVGVELSKKIGKVSAYLGGGYTRSDFNGGFITVGIMF